MNIRRRIWQAVPVVAALAGGFALTATPVQAQSSGGSSFGGSTGSSMGGSTGSSGSSNSSSSNSTGATSVANASTNTLSNSNSLSNSSLSGSGIGTQGAGGTTGNSNYRSGSLGPSQSNILAPYYVNPLQPGLPNSTSLSGGSSSGGGGGG